MNSSSNISSETDQFVNTSQPKGKAAFYLTELSINYKRIGAERYKYIEAGAGKTIIMLHGAGGSKFMWRGVMRSLAKSYRVISLDLPGYTPFSKVRPSFNHLANWLWAFVDELGIQHFTLAGYSAAAGLCCHMASQCPERIEKLILISMPKWPGLNGDKNPLLFRMHKEATGSLEERFAQHANVLFHEPPQLSSFMNKSSLLAFSMMESRMEAIIEATNIGFAQLPARLRKILHIPMISIYGDDDRFGSEETTAYFQLYGTNIRSYVIPKCGHMPFFEKPKELSAAISKFLRTQPLTHVVS